MTDQDKIIIESDSRGRIRIGCEDAEGDGHGYRLAGPKYSDGGGKTLARVELGERDVTQIRLYLSMWDEANGAALPAPPAEASDADVVLALEAADQDVLNGSVTLAELSTYGHYAERLRERFVITRRETIDD